MGTDVAPQGISLHARATSIPGLTIWKLPIHRDNRGWFKENWHREKMGASGLPDFKPVQNNVSFNEAVGTTRGIHAEPWDKYISVVSGRIFGAWVDLRDGPTFGESFTAQLDPSDAVFVPRGVGNAFQTLESHTVYVYLVNDHYSTDTTYTSVNLADETVAIRWPIRLEDAELSVKDRGHPRLAAIEPVPPRKILVVGAGGQLGRALRAEYADRPEVEFVNRAELALGSGALAGARRWRDFGTIINAAAYTAVDAAETPDGRVEAWSTNVAGVAELAQIATEADIALVHLSSDYVYDGAMGRPYREDDLMAPLGVYGQTKAAGDQIVATVPRHYIVRTSWVVGDGRNFVSNMLSLAERGVNPSVVNDQHGRLTFTSELARAIRHLVERQPQYGTYNVTGAGEVATWAEVARQVFDLAGHDPSRVSAVTTAEYFATARGPIAPRPRNSVLDTTKVERAGLELADVRDMLLGFIRPPNGESSCAKGDSVPPTVGGPVKDCPSSRGERP